LLQARHSALQNPQSAYFAVNFHRAESLPTPVAFVGLSYPNRSVADAS
jgi:hypothetical protein